MLSTAGDIASVLGFPLALLGIFLTIREAKRAKKAAEGARDAANEALGRLKAHYLADQIGMTQKVVEGVEVACSTKAWDEAARQCRTARHLLARLAQHGRLPPDDGDAFRLMIVALGEVQASAQKHADNPERRSPFPKSQLKQVDEIRVRLSETQGRLDNSTWEV